MSRFRERGTRRVPRSRNRLFTSPAAQLPGPLTEANGCKSFCRFRRYLTPNKNSCSTVAPKSMLSAAWNRYAMLSDWREMCPASTVEQLHQDEVEEHHSSRHTRFTDECNPGHQ